MNTSGCDPSMRPIAVFIFAPDKIRNAAPRHGIAALAPGKCVFDEKEITDQTIMLRPAIAVLSAIHRLCDAFKTSNANTAPSINPQARLGVQQKSRARRMERAPNA